jgi:hypothetical protein
LLQEGETQSSPLRSHCQTKKIATWARKYTPGPPHVQSVIKKYLGVQICATATGEEHAAAF